MWGFTQMQHSGGDLLYICGNSLLVFAESIVVLWGINPASSGQY